MVTSASCLIHLKQQNGGGEVDGGKAPSLATAAWGCLQQPRVGFPERDSKPDILRLQNTQVSRAKNSCHRVPAGLGGGGGWLGPCLQLRQQKEARGQLRFVALTSSLLLGAQLLILQSFSLLPWTDGMPLLGAGPSPRPLTWEPSLWPWSP